MSVVSRIGASFIGGYAFVWGCAALGWSLLVIAGVDFPDARTSALLLAFPVFLVVFLWAYVEANVWYVWTVLGGGGVVMGGAAWLLIQGMHP